MEQVLTFLGLGWVGTLLGIAGLILSVWFYLLSKREASPVYNESSVELVGSAYRTLPDSVSILYNNHPVPRVVKTSIQFWNDGKMTLRGEDMASTEPLRLVIEDGEFLTVAVSKSTRAANKAEARVNPANPREVLITFEFLDYMDGLLLQCLHTGKWHTAKLAGVFKGVPQGIRIGGPSRSFYKARRRLDLATLFLLICSLFVAASTLTNLGKNLMLKALTFFPGQPDEGVVKALILCLAAAIYTAARSTSRYKAAYPPEIAEDQEYITL